MARAILSLKKKAGQKSDYLQAEANPHQALPRQQSWSISLGPGTIRDGIWV